MNWHAKIGSSVIPYRPVNAGELPSRKSLSELERIENMNTTAAQIVAPDDPRAKKTKDRIGKPPLDTGEYSDMLIPHFGKTNAK